MSTASHSIRADPLVLIADHELLYRWFAVESLESVGHRAIPFATVAELLTFLDHAHEDLIILVDEQTLLGEAVDPSELLRHASSVIRMCVLADMPNETRLGPCSHAVVPKPCDRDALVALVD